jgi:hypothetical protein
LGGGRVASAKRQFLPPKYIKITDRQQTEIIGDGRAPRKKPPGGGFLALQL